MASINFEQMRERCQRDPSLAVFMVRDLPETEAAGLKDLAWCLCYDCHKNDALGFFDMLEAWVDGENQDESDEQDRLVDMIESRRIGEIE